MEMSGLKTLSTSIASAEAMKAKLSSRWVKMKRLPSRKSRPRWCSFFGEGGRMMASVPIMAAEKAKEPASAQKQTRSVKASTRRPAMAGETMRTT
jgi:hypothetical protein